MALVGAMGLAVAGCSGIGGSPSPAPAVSAPASSSGGSAGGKSAVPVTGPASTSPTGPSAAVAARAPRGSSAATIPAAGPVAGLPHAQPLPGTVLVDSRAVDGVSDLYLVDTTPGGTGGRRLTGGLGGGQYPVLSPDRGTIVYLWHGPDGATIRVLAADGSGDRPLLSPAAARDCPAPGRPAWNPADPTEIVLACRSDTGSRLYVVGVDGDVRRTLDPGATVFEDPTFSPDGRDIAIWTAADVKAGGGALAVLPADGSGPARPVTRPADAEDVDPVWTVDGASLLFRRSVPGSGVARILSVAVHRTAGGATTGGEVTPVTDGSAFDFDPTVSPDGRQVAFKSNRGSPGGAGGDQVWVQGVDGSGLRTLDSPGVSAGAPEWGRR